MAKESIEAREAVVGFSVLLERRLRGLERRVYWDAEGNAVPDPVAEMVELLADMVQGAREEFLGADASVPR
jgi:hypothetical protein